MYFIIKEARYVQLDDRNVTFLYYEDNEEWQQRQFCPKL